MADSTNEKMGTVIIEGKIYNLDTMSSEELEKLYEVAKKQRDETEKKIKKLLKI